MMFRSVDKILVDGHQLHEQVTAADDDGLRRIRGGDGDQTGGGEGGDGLEKIVARGNTRVQGGHTRACGGSSPPPDPRRGLVPLTLSHCSWQLTRPVQSQPPAPTHTVQPATKSLFVNYSMCVIITTFHKMYDIFFKYI